MSFLILPCGVLLVYHYRRFPNAQCSSLMWVKRWRSVIASDELNWNINLVWEIEKTYPEDLILKLRYSYSWPQNACIILRVEILAIWIPNIRTFGWSGSYSSKQWIDSARIIRSYARLYLPYFLSLMASGNKQIWCTEGKERMKMNFQWKTDHHHTDLFQTTSAMRDDPNTIPCFQRMPS